MAYLYIKSLHIIFVVSWFAGLFYMPRLLVYHTEANARPDAERAILFQQFIKMEGLLFRAIMVPAMWLTLLTGTAMLYLMPDWLSQGWMHIKLTFVLGLVGYHLYTRRLLYEVKAGRFRFSSFQLRLWNEVATVFLFAIVFLVILKSTVQWLWGVGGLVLFAVIIMSAVRIARNRREKKQN
ncbi:CopD family protein [Arundinibacter roseus]|uniref:Protoporphyrinogen IX oxidase n=1 Tax=Arundinibacter roseus TaxID=2070510 RepID=A0A4R4KM03_9BACT|nr:CopD family protein [Arundinibacter roseus]TDB69003.1 CopD family protein [Arundinibacter roseus]